MNDLKVGDIIHFQDVQSMIDASENLAKEDIMTDFLYEKDGKEGFWLEVVATCVEVPTLEEVKGKMCDKYCKWPCTIKSQEALDAICDTCPLAKYEV